MYYKILELPTGMRPEIMELEINKFAGITGYKLIFVITYGGAHLHYFEETFKP